MKYRVNKKEGAFRNILLLKFECVALFAKPSDGAIYAWQIFFKIIAMRSNYQKIHFQKQHLLCLKVILIFKSLLLLIYAPYQYLTHCSLAYVQFMKKRSNCNNIVDFKRLLF